MKFTDLNLIEPILRAVSEEGYETPTPIQQQAIPLVLDRSDLLGVAQTGTGKTAAFAIPILQILVEKLRGQRRPQHISTLVLTPTRELAIQIDESFRAYGRHTGLRTTVIFGGVGQKPQTDALARGIDILVATPGRLLDLIGQGFVDLSKLQIFVLDEADRMLDMGFVHDVKKVIARLPKERQSLFFSATMPPDIVELANSILTDPQKVEVTPPATTADTVNQFVYFVSKEDKRQLLPHIIKEKKLPSVLVFTRTKHGADKVAKDLSRHGISSAAIHGNKGQGARQTALQNFKDRKITALVATDIAARGIDIDELGHVVNFDLPNIPESYVHRIGRTGRAGASGMAFSFCDDEEKEYLRDIQKLIGKVVPPVEEHPWPLESGSHVPLEFPKQKAKQSQKQPQRPARIPVSNQNQKTANQMDQKHHDQPDDLQNQNREPRQQNQNREQRQQNGQNQNREQRQQHGQNQNREPRQQNQTGGPRNNHQSAPKKHGDRRDNRNPEQRPSDKPAELLSEAKLRPPRQKPNRPEAQPPVSGGNSRAFARARPSNTATKPKSETPKKPGKWGWLKGF